jgi:hypothetical protein
MRASQLIRFSHDLWRPVFALYRNGYDVRFYSVLAVFSVDLLDDSRGTASIQCQIASLGRQLHGGAEFVLLVHLVIGLGQGHADHVDIALQLIRCYPS